MVPWADDSIADERAVDERSAIMRAIGAHGVAPVAGASEQDLCLADRNLFVISIDDSGFITFNNFTEAAQLHIAWPV